MRTRTGEEIEIALLDGEGNRRTLDDTEFSFLFLHNRATMARMTGACLTRLDVQSLHLLSSVFVRQYLLRRHADAQKRLLVDRLLRFESQSIEVRFNGKRAVVVHCAETRGLVKCIFLQNQYHAVERNIRDKVVVDAGAHTGTFSIMAAMLGAKKVYAFEPFRETFGLLKRNIQANALEHTIVATNKALGDKNESRSLYTTGAPDGHSSFHPLGGGPSEEAEILRLDDFLKDERVDFMKVDTEGWEEAVLRGAQESIRQHGPVLSIAAYHTPEDKERLAHLVTSIRPAYEVQVHDFGELDLYCE